MEHEQKVTNINHAKFDIHTFDNLEVTRTFTFNLHIQTILAKIMWDKLAECTASTIDQFFAKCETLEFATRATDINSGNGRLPPESVIGKQKSTDDCATTKEKFSSLRLRTLWKYSMALPRLIYCCGFTRPRGWRGRSSRNWIGLLATIQSRAPCATSPPNKGWGHFKHWSTAAATTKCCPDTEWHLRGWQRSAAKFGFQAIMLVGSSTGWTMIRWAHCEST